MSRAGPEKVHRHSLKFKLKAVKLSQLKGIEVQAVARALDIHPFMLSRWRKEARDGVLRGAVSRPRPVPPKPPAREIPRRRQGLFPLQGLRPPKHGANHESRRRRVSSQVPPPRTPQRIHTDSLLRLSCQPTPCGKTPAGPAPLEPPSQLDPQPAFHLRSFRTGRPACRRTRHLSPNASRDDSWSSHGSELLSTAPENPGASTPHEPTLHAMICKPPLINRTSQLRPLELRSPAIRNRPRLHVHSMAPPWRPTALPAALSPPSPSPRPIQSA